MQLAMDEVAEGGRQFDVDRHHPDAPVGMGRTLAGILFGDQHRQVIGKDQLAAIERMVVRIRMRVDLDAVAAQKLEEAVRIADAGDGMHEHPTQALLDAFTMIEHKGRLAGLRVAIIGDLLHSRVFRSNALLLTRMGATVRACAPPTLRPPGLPALGIHVTSSMDDAIEGAD